MRGHEIGDEELFFAEFFVRLSVRSDEFFRARPGRFSHVREDLGARVFRGDLELSAYVVGAELLQKCVSARICQNVIVSDAGADENLLDPGNLPHSPEKGEIPPVIALQLSTRLGIEARLPAASPVRRLSVAGAPPEIGGRAAHVVNVAFEVGISCHLFCLEEDAL